MQLLAHELSQPSTRRMLSGMSASEYKEWRPYFSKRGFYCELEDWRMGSICATVWNINQSKADALRTPQSFYEFSELPDKSDEQLMAGAEGSGGIRVG